MLDYNDIIKDTCCSNSDYNIDIRTELIIKESSQTICNVLQDLNCQKIRVDGYLVQALCDKCSVFRFVVGSSDCQSITDLQVAKSILCDLDIDYLETGILKVNSGHRSKLDLANIFCALQRNVNVDASYFAKREGIYFQSEPLDEAINALKSSDC